MSRDKLVSTLARLQGHRRELQTLRESLLARARDQRDSMPEVVDHVEAHVDADQAGGVMGLRRLRTLHDERKRLGDVIERLERKP